MSKTKSYNMVTLFFLFLILIVLLLIGSGSVNAYVPTDIHNNISYKFYSDKMNKTYYYGIIEQIPKQYLINIKMIKIETRLTNCGEYWFHNNVMIIKLNCGSIKRLLTHEITHSFLTYNDGHEQIFYALYEKIYPEINKIKVKETKIKYEFNGVQKN